METSMVAPKTPHDQPPPLACRGGGVLAGAAGLSVVLLWAGMNVALGTTDLGRSSDFSVPLHTRLVSLVRSGSAQEAPVVVAASIQEKEEAIFNRAQDVAAFINGVTLSEQLLSIDASSRDPLSPEEQALQWLINHDPLQLSIGTPSDQFRLIQRYALLTLWFQQFYGRHQFHWKWTFRWLNNDECFWYGIECEQFDFGGDIGLQNAVTAIFLSGNNLHGTIPADLTLLQSVQIFDVTANDIQGTLPSSMGLWTSLRVFEVFNNLLVGSIPSSFAAWGPSIGDVSLGNNVLTGTLPDELWQGTAHWCNLTSLDLSSNLLTGTLSTFINQWTKLEVLRVDNNGFKGSMPNVWPVTLRSLVLANNDLTGTLPMSLNRLTHLEIFAVDNNALTGALPDYRVGSKEWPVYGLWPSLVTFSIADNVLKGSIPESIGNWAPNTLKTLSLRGNGFTGTLPESLGNSTRMLTFDVADNALTGTLPPSLGQWTGIDDFSVARNAFTGSIPESFGTWIFFRSVFFDHNNFEGSVPDGLCHAQCPVELTADCQEKVTCACCTECYYR